MVDDYGHHPTEIRATLETLRGRAGTPPHGRALPAAPLHAHPAPVGRVLPRLPPRRPARSSSTSIPRARSRSRAITAEALADAIARRGHRQVVYAGDLKAADERLAAEVREGDVVLTLGAGSVWTAGDELLDERRRSRQRSASSSPRRGSADQRRAGCSTSRRRAPAVRGDEPPFLRPERRTRVRRARRGWTYRHDRSPCSSAAALLVTVSRALGRATRG